jgi:hypothetical protein
MLGSKGQAVDIGLVGKYVFTCATLLDAAHQLPSTRLPCLSSCVHSLRPLSKEYNAVGSDLCLLVARLIEYPLAAQDPFTYFDARDVVS